MYRPVSSSWIGLRKGGDSTTIAEPLIRDERTANSSGILRSEKQEHRSPPQKIRFKISGTIDLTRINSSTFQGILKPVVNGNSTDFHFRGTRVYPNPLLCFPSSISEIPRHMIPHMQHSASVLYRNSILTILSL